MNRTQQFVYDIEIRATARANAATEPEARALIETHLASFNIDWRRDSHGNRMVRVNEANLSDQSKPQLREMDLDMDDSAPPPRSSVITVADLICQLQKLDPSARVVQSKDAGGNGFSPTAGLSSGVYTPDTPWSGDFRTFEELEGDEWIPGPEEQAAVCVWPTN